MDYQKKNLMVFNFPNDGDRAAGFCLHTINLLCIVYLVFCSHFKSSDAKAITE